MKTIKLRLDNIEYTLENRPPLDEEIWTYIGFDEPIVFTKNVLPDSWWDKLWDIGNYYTVVHTEELNLNQ